MASNEGNAPVLKGHWCSRSTDVDEPVFSHFVGRLKIFNPAHLHVSSKWWGTLSLHEGGGTECLPPAGCKCAAPAPQLECDWSGMSDGLIIQKKKKNPRRQTEALGSSRRCALRDCCGVFIWPAPTKNSWTGAFSLRRVELIAFSPALSQVPKWSHFTLISL